MVVASLNSKPNYAPDSGITRLNSKQKGLFVSNASYLSSKLGGVQLCTQEYQQTLAAAGFELSILPYQTTTHPLARLRRKWWPLPYRDRLPQDLVNQILEAIHTQSIQTIFLNQVDLAPLAEPLRLVLGDRITLVLLSHGLESIDLFHGLRTRQPGALFHRVSDRDRTQLAHSLIAECQHRQWIDQVFCLSSFELELERWLGAKQVTWLPRIIQKMPLDWQPQGRYLGFVGTLNHSPNWEGLLLFLTAFQAIAPEQVRIRIVGGPEENGKAIARQFKCVDYLGRLDDAALAKEACSWNAMVHPLFCYSRGCSTKLAIALGWQIPVLTTHAGCRGYQWELKTLPLADTPQALAQLALSVLEPQRADELRQAVIHIGEHSPNLQDIAAIIQHRLPTASE